MGHGTPDWWGAEPTTTIFQVQDLGELAARLGSIVTFDRRGNVVFLDDFESGLTPRWRTNADYTGTPVFSTAAARSGAYSVRLRTTALSGAGCGILHWRPLPVQGKIGLEVSFSIETHIGSLTFGLEFYDGSYSYIFRVRYLPASDKWQYQDSAGVWQDLFTSMALYKYPQIFHTLKMVVDYENGEYFYVIVNEREQSLSGIAGMVDTSVSTPIAGIFITAINDGANVGKAYIDDVIITQNEP